MRKTWWLIAAAMPLLAAAPNRQLSLSVPSDSTLQPLAPPSATAPRQRYEPAPLPDRGLALTVPRTTAEPHVAPTLFTTRDQYRGDGFSRGSTAQAEQEHRYKPPVGFSLHMPFQPE